MKSGQGKRGKGKQREKGGEKGKEKWELKR